MQPTTLPAVRPAHPGGIPLPNPPNQRNAPTPHPPHPPQPTPPPQAVQPLPSRFRARQFRNAFTAPEVAIASQIATELFALERKREAGYASELNAHEINPSAELAHRDLQSTWKEECFDLEWDEKEEEEMIIIVPESPNHADDYEDNDNDDDAKDDNNGKASDGSAASRPFLNLYQDETAGPSLAQKRKREDTTDSGVQTDCTKSLEKKAKYIERGLRDVVLLGVGMVSGAFLWTWASVIFKELTILSRIAADILARERAVGSISPLRVDPLNARFAAEGGRSDTFNRTSVWTKVDLLLKQGRQLEEEARGWEQSSQTRSDSNDNDYDYNSNSDKEYAPPSPASRSEPTPPPQPPRKSQQSGDGAFVESENEEELLVIPKSQPHSADDDEDEDYNGEASGVSAASLSFEVDPVDATKRSLNRSEVEIAGPAAGQKRKRSETADSGIQTDWGEGGMMGTGNKRVKTNNGWIRDVGGWIGCLVAGAVIGVAAVGLLC
ncbi:hypothetical protein HDU98_010621 [Podochytrium sp. JEL0797]|nr:hypothetical protein HDU98_010621 [Podochytrium sp. JEL0797]